MKRLLAVLLSLALLAWFVGDARWRELDEAFGRLTPPMLGLGAAGFFLSYLLRALRVHDEFRRDARGRFGACLRIVLIHNAMINVVPFRGGEAAFPVLLRQSFDTPVGRALASLFWFRLQDAFVVGMLAVIVWPDLPVAVRLAGLAALIGCAWYLPRWARAPHDWSAGRPIAAKLGRLRDALGETTRHARYGWLWTVANWTAKLTVQAWLLAALLPATPTVGAAGALGAELAAILPVQGVAGFGTYEAGAAAALLPNGVALEDGLRAALVLHLFVIACAVTAGTLAWLAPSRSRPAASDKHPPVSGNS